MLDGIREIRTKAFQDALPPLREEAIIFYGNTMEQWAGKLLRADLNRIENAVRSGLSARLPSAEIVRKVIGSVGLKGLDDQTEVTRHGGSLRRFSTSYFGSLECGRVKPLAFSHLTLRDARHQSAKHRFR